MRMRRGATLVEVALAGAIAVLLTLAFMEGIAVAARISHENSQLLAAEAYAWDTAWKWLNKPYDELNNTATAAFYPSAAGETVSSNACPVLCRALNGTLDITLGAVTSLWGFAGDAPRLPAAEEISAASSVRSFALPDPEIMAAIVLGDCMTAVPVSSMYSIS